MMGLVSKKYYCHEIHTLPTRSSEVVLTSPLYRHPPPFYKEIFNHSLPFFDFPNFSPLPLQIMRVHNMLQRMIYCWLWAGIYQMVSTSFFADLEHVFHLPTRMANLFYLKKCLPNNQIHNAQVKYFLVRVIVRHIFLNMKWIYICVRTKMQQENMQLLK